MDSTLSMTRGEREAIDAKRRERVLRWPQWTLIRVGWEIEPGRVQGSVYYRIADGLGPIGRDHRATDVLREAVQGFYSGPQQWGIQVLAAAVSDTDAFDSPPVRPGGHIGPAVDAR